MGSKYFLGFIRSRLYLRMYFGWQVSLVSLGIKKMIINKYREGNQTSHQIRNTDVEDSQENIQIFKF